MVSLLRWSWPSGQVHRTQALVFLVSKGVGSSPGHDISLTQNLGGYKLCPFECSKSGSFELTRNPCHLHCPGHDISLTQNQGGYKLGPFECSNVMTRIPGQNVLTRNPGHLHWPGIRSFALTRNPGHLNWPGIPVIWIDPESGSFELTRNPVWRFQLSAVFSFPNDQIR